MEIFFMFVSLIHFVLYCSCGSWGQGRSDGNIQCFWWRDFSVICTFVV